MEMIGWAVILGYLIGWLTEPEKDKAGVGEASRPPTGSEAAASAGDPAPAPVKKETVRIVRVRHHRRRIKKPDPGEAAPATETPDSERTEQ